MAEEGAGAAEAQVREEPRPTSVTPEPKLRDTVSPDSKPKPPPPVVREKPQRKSVDYSLRDEGGVEDGGEGGVKRKPIGTTMPMGQLASVLQQGIGTTPLKPRVRWLTVS